jgi:hypothetical protein
MSIKSTIFGQNRNNLAPQGQNLSAVDQAYFLYYGNGRQGDVFGTKGAIAMLCLEILAQCPELSDCRIGRFNSGKSELLSDIDILKAAAEYAQKGIGAVPSLSAGINLSSWRTAGIKSAIPA